MYQILSLQSHEPQGDREGRPIYPAWFLADTLFTDCMVPPAKNEISDCKKILIFP